MAHFAQLENNIVQQVIVIDNSDTLNAQGDEDESVGAQFCSELLGGTWLQTSYNGTTRKNYAGIGDTYDSIRNAFISVKPYPSWVLDEDTCLYEAPIPYPSEEERGIVGVLWNELGTESRDYYQTMDWDESSVSWVNDDIPEDVITP